jgi:hypothetical protein
MIAAHFDIREWKDEKKIKALVSQHDDDSPKLLEAIEWRHGIISCVPQRLSSPPAIGQCSQGAPTAVPTLQPAAVRGTSTAQVSMAVL